MNNPNLNAVSVAALAAEISIAQLGRYYKHLETHEPTLVEDNRAFFSKDEEVRTSLYIAELMDTYAALVVKEAQVLLLL